MYLSTHCFGAFMPVRWIDPEKSRGNRLEPGGWDYSGLSDAITEVGLPCSRAYDATAELQRIRGIYAQEDEGSRARRRPAIAFNQNRSLRRCS
jgi:hypothetical protein